MLLLNQGEATIGAKLRRVGVFSGDELRRGEEAILSSASCCRLVSRSHSTTGVKTFGEGWAKRGDLGGCVWAFTGVTLAGVTDCRSGDAETLAAGGGACRKGRETLDMLGFVKKSDGRRTTENAFFAGEGDGATLFGVGFGMA